MDDEQHMLDACTAAEDVIRSLNDVVEQANAAVLAIRPRDLPLDALEVYSALIKTSKIAVLLREQLTLAIGLPGSTDLGRRRHSVRAQRTG